MKLLFKIIGTISLGLGLIGIFLPVLPTTPFLLLTAALYARSSDKLYNLLMSHYYLGAYIKDFREHRTLPLRVKIISVSTLWITICLSIYMVDILFVKIMFVKHLCAKTFVYSSPIDKHLFIHLLLMNVIHSPIDEHGDCLHFGLL